MARAPLLGRGLHALWSGEAAPRSADGQPVPWDVIIVGMGDMGHALARYNGFVNRGYQVTMLFDNNPAKIDPYNQTLK